MPRTVLPAAVMAAVLLAAVPALAIEVDLPTTAQSRPSNPDLWRQIKQGQTGAPSATASDPVLVKPIPGCTDRATGFTTPVNVHIPVVGTPQGQGPSTAALVLLAAVFGLFTGAGAMLARNLGKHGS